MTPLRPACCLGRRALRGQPDVQRKGAGGVVALAAEAARRAGTVNDLQAAAPLTAHGVEVPGSAAHHVVAECDELYERVVSLRAFDGLADLLFALEDKHWYRALSRVMSN